MWAHTTTTVVAATAATAVLCVARRSTQGTEEEESPSLLPTPASTITRPADLLRASDQRLGALEQCLDHILKALAASSQTRRDGNLSAQALRRICPPLFAFSVAKSLCVFLISSSMLNEKEVDVDIW